MSDHDRGRAAEGPTGIPARGWKDVLVRTKDEIADDHVNTVSAGVAFWALLALFPALAALVSIYGLVADPSQVTALFESLSSFIPGQGRELLSSQVEQLAASGSTRLGVGAAVGLLLTLYSASSGMKSLIDGLNVAFDEKEERGFLKLNLTALGLTLLALVVTVVAIALLAAVPAAVGAIGLPSWAQSLITIGRWPVLALLAIGMLSLVYRFGPSRASPRWRWVTPGAVGATALWLVVCAGFSIYVRNFGSYGETYGSLGGVIVLMLWLFLTALSILLGAELDAELERQTRQDTTTGEPQPMGERGAFAADDLGEPA